MSSDSAASTAAEVVLRERERQREEADRKAKSTAAGSDQPKKPQLEKVSEPKWEGAEQGEVDTSELDRRQRALSEQLEARQKEVLRQGEKLAQVREELRALEAPIKNEIMQLRESMERANREEIAVVSEVNSLRSQLFDKEKRLAELRTEKQTSADQLIRVMADYERRKTERLNEISDLVSGDTVKKKVATPSKSTFLGF